MNETVNSQYGANLTRLLDFIDQEWHVSRKELFEAEFGAYVHLNFSLHIPAAHIFVVSYRLLRLVNKSLGDYLGEEMTKVYRGFCSAKRARVKSERSAGVGRSVRMKKERKSG